MGRRAAVAFGLALSALVLVCGGVAIDYWMTTLPPIETSCGPGCTQSHTSPLEQEWVGVVLVMVGLVMLAIAWSVDRGRGAKPREGRKPVWSWGAPLWWLVFLPLIAGPATYLLAGLEADDRSCQTWVGYVGGGGADCPASVFVPSVVLPGLLNFVPLLWLYGAGPRRRIAAAVAGVLGIAGFVTSIVVLASLGTTISWDFGFLVPNLPPPQEADAALGLVFWLSAIIALLVIAKLRLPPERTTAPGV